MRRLLSIRDFCSAYGCGRTRAYALIAAGQLVAVKNGRRTLIDEESADAWAASLPRILAVSAGGDSSLKLADGAYEPV